MPKSQQMHWSPESAHVLVMMHARGLVHRPSLLTPSQFGIVQRSAQSAKLKGHDPYAYLIKDVLARHADAKEQPH
jgi:hypothetical protein